MTMETNPDLLPIYCNADSFCPVFQLSPTDKDQAKTAVEFAKRKGGESFLIVKGSINTVYSNYLANQILEQIHESHKSVVIMTTDSAVFHPEVLKALQVNCVFFIGEHHQALVVIRQIKRLGITRGTFLLSDSAADPKLPQIGQEDLEGVFLTHPRSADEIANEKIGYVDFGKDVRSIIAALLAEAETKLKGRSGFVAKLKEFYTIRRISDARQALISSMKQKDNKKNNDIDEKVFKRDGSPVTYRFIATRGRRLLDGKFHIWQIKNGRYTEVPQSDISVRASQQTNRVQPKSSPNPFNSSMGGTIEPDPDFD